MPTYGDLIDLLDESGNDVPSLTSKVRERFPEVSVGRAGRFYETVQRIAAPTKPSILGEAKLNGSPLATYRSRIWKPRIRTINESATAPGMYYVLCYTMQPPLQYKLINLHSCVP